MKTKGFTILEILVVLAVLAILIGIAVPRIKGMQEQANIAKAKAELKTIQTAIESYYINKGIYPDTSNQIAKDILGESNIPQILSQILYDPFRDGSSEYRYRRSTNGKYYVISSDGIDGAGGKVGVSNEGVVSVEIEGADDICVTNGTGCD